MAGALDRRFWLASGDLDLAESQRWLDAGLAIGAAVPGRVRAKALQRLASTHALSSARWLSALEEALAEYVRAGDEAGMTQVLSALGSMDIYRGDLALPTNASAEVSTSRAASMPDPSDSWNSSFRSVCLHIDVAMMGWAVRSSKRR